MRPALQAARLPLLAAVAALLAGCSAPPAAPGPEPAAGRLVAEGFDASGTVVAGEEGVILFPVADDLCTVPTSRCSRHPFEVRLEGAGNASELEATATLTWSVPANDFDLHLLAPDGSYLVRDTAAPPATQSSFTVALGEPGTYTVLVVPFTTAADQWSLNVAFR